MKLKKEDVVSVKGRGFLRNRGTDCFSGRLVSVAGIFSPDELRAIAECAEKFGSGKVIFTARLSAEIVGIPFEMIPEAEAFMKERNLYFGGTGAKIRPITACKGTTCVYGNIDTHALANIIHNKFYVGMKDVKLPHKFKIGIGGCPNSCMKPSLNDVGIEGCRSFEFDREKCKGCKVCAVAEGCPSRAVSVESGKASVDPEKCTKCGVCVGKCPFGAVPKEASGASKIYVGGTWGKIRREGIMLSGTYTFDEIPEVIEKVMLWYKENGYQKERLRQTIDRIGIDALEAAIGTNDLTERREEIINKPCLER